MSKHLLTELIQYAWIVFWSILIITILLKKGRKNHHSNWNYLIDDFAFSTDEFYEIFKEKFTSRGIKYVSFKTVNLKVGNVFPIKKKYLQIRWKDYEYLICASVFGKGFFVSWWLLYKKYFFEILISKIPFIGEFLVRKLFPVTYYSIDSASAFMTYAQSIVKDVIEEITKDTGVKLNLENQKPILNDIFRR